MAIKLGNGIIDQISEGKKTRRKKLCTKKWHTVKYRNYVELECSRVWPENGAGEGRKIFRICVVSLQVYFYMCYVFSLCDGKHM